VTILLVMLLAFLILMKGLSNKMSEDPEKAKDNPEGTNPPEA
jgi:hypothetical protein